jgi:hypothetical protein
MSWMATLLLAAQLAAGGLTTIARGDSSAVEEPREVVARTASEWDALWKAHSSAPPPAIDLAGRMVAGVFLGVRPTAGYGVEVRGTALENGVLVIEWAETRPDPGAVVAQLLTSPFQIVALPTHGGAVRFRKVAPDQPQTLAYFALRIIA